MMVTRPANLNLYKTPPGSRGTSPSRNTKLPSPKSNGRKLRESPDRRRASPQRTPEGRAARTSQESPDRRRASPQRTPEGRAARRSQESPDRRRASPQRTPEGRAVLRSRGSSPATKRLQDIMGSSHGSEMGSIDGLDTDNKFRRIITSFNQAEDNINVVVRVRPLNGKEVKLNDSAIVQFPGNGQVLVDGTASGINGGQKQKLFSYNVVFEPAATQEDVLQFSGMKRLIEMSLEGFRCTCFCYGQTGSGKTHTLTGPPGLFGLKTYQYSDKHGLIFRSFMYLFKLIKEKPDVHFILKASYLEIYNEKVIDLLNPGSARKPLAVRWSKKARGFFVENLFTVDCEEVDDLIAVLEEGLRNRSVGRHNMNDYSSRSHTILSVHITSEQPAENGVFISRSGKINFVDLAGSEMTKKTQSEGKTLEEANNINKSLMVLGYCISSLSDSKRKTSHIPYRDSKLTKLLADSLAGNGVTLMIACISPAKSNFNETINTLRYASRAKKIRTKPIVLMDPREALILSLKREVGVLQEENEHLRSALNVHSALSSDGSEKRIITTPPKIDLEELSRLDGPKLTELLHLYMVENDVLRKEIGEMYNAREIMQRDHELVCRENERLLKKIEEVNSSPLVVARPAFSAEILNSSDAGSSTNIWTNPLQDKTKSNNEIPESIEKELEKRQIGSGYQTRNHRRHNSWDGKTNGTKIVRVKSSNSDGKVETNTVGTNDLSRKRYSMAQKNAPPNSEVFGSVISMTDDED